MFKTQNKWKLGALLLSAPLLLPAVAQAKDYEQTQYTAESIRSSLKQGYRWQGTDGEVLLLRQDGMFEARVAEDSGYTYTRDFGRFSVRPVNKDDYTNDLGEKFMLVLKVTSSVKKSDKKGGKSKVVQRVALRELPIKLYSNRPNNDDRYDPYLYVLLMGQRYNQPNKYKE